MNKIPTFFFSRIFITKLLECQMSGPHVMISLKKSDKTDVCALDWPRKLSDCWNKGCKHEQYSESHWNLGRHCREKVY